MQKQTIRLSIDFPRSEYPYLKLLLARKGTSLREMANELLIKAIEDEEDKLLNQEADRRLAESSNEELISWEKATKLAGWDKEVRSKNVQKVSKRPSANSGKRPLKNKGRSSKPRSQSKA